jgi:hypothetical protein
MQALTANSESFVRTAGGARSAIAALAGERILLASPLPAGLHEFALVVRHGVNSIEIPFAGQPTSDGNAIDVGQQYSSPALAALLSGSAVDASLLRQMTDAPARPLPAKRSAGGSMATLIVGILCLAAGAYVAERLYFAATTIVPRTAYLSTAVSSMASPTSGQISFLAEIGPVRSGEPVFGVDTNNGKTIFVDAAADIEIVSQSIRLGAHVTRGGAVLAVAAPDPTTYLEAVVTREEAFRLGHGTVASYLVLGDENAVRAEVQIAPGAISATPIVDELGRSIDQLYKVRVPVESEGKLYSLAPVELSYRQTVTARGRAVLEGLGASEAVSSLLLAPFGWLSSIIGREV